MSQYNELAKITYERIFHEDLNFLSDSLEKLKTLIQRDMSFLEKKLEQKLYIEFIKSQIKIKKLDVAEKQRKKYGQVLLNDYETIQHLYSWLNSFEFSSDGRKRGENTPQQKETEPTNSFKYNTPNQQTHIENILNKLKRNDENIVFVNEKVYLTYFKKTFNNTPLNKIGTIDWQGKSIASLRYFIKQFPFEMSNENRFKITAHCFTHNGNKLNYSQIENAKQLSLKHRRAIDNIFKRYPFKK